MAITTQDIHATADRLLADGQQPTLAAIRAALGGGSFTTISEGVKSWKALQQAAASTAPIREAAPVAIIEQMTELATDIWEIALNIANNRLKSERDAMAQTRIEIEKAQAEAAELADQLADDLDTSKANLNVAKGQIDNLKESMLLAEAQAKREIEAMTEKMAASHEKAHTSQAALAESRKRADELAAMLTTADQARIHADQAKATAEQTAAVLAAKLDAAEQLKVNYEKEITTLMQRELEAINRADIAEKHASDLATDRDMAVMSAAEARERTAKLAGQLEATLTQNAALLAQLVPPKPVKAIKQPNPTQPNLINK